jgi:L-ascorbate metabolism protein UlaG (beta-lactamase superfamily)
MPQLIYYGHSCFLINDDHARLIFDPYLTGNSNVKVDIKQIITDYILLSHAHRDHLGDAIALAQNNNATVIASHELATYCESKGCKTHSMNIGGSCQFPFGRVKLTIAHHSSGSILSGKTFSYMGSPCGFLVSLAGKTLYHAGDTGLFGDMKLIGELNPIHVALLPVGDNYTMGIDDAVKAAQFLQPELVVPMHYNTFDEIKIDVMDFQKKVEAAGLTAAIMNYNDTLDF